MTLEDVIRAGHDRPTPPVRVYLHPRDLNDVAPMHWYPADFRTTKALYQNIGGFQEWHANVTVQRGQMRFE